jgi:hypothetical protein
MHALRRDPPQRPPGPAAAAPPLPHMQVRRFCCLEEKDMDICVFFPFLKKKISIFNLCVSTN